MPNSDTLAAGSYHAASHARPLARSSLFENVQRLFAPRAIPGLAELAAKLFLLGLVLQPAGSWSTRALVLVLASSALLNIRVLHTPALWLGLALLSALRLVIDWPLSDNHAYLGAYWCLAVGLGLLVPEPRRAIRLSARQLLALTFALAVIWKAFLSPDYLDGRFFRVTLLKDDRFTQAVMLFTGLSRGEILANREALAPPPPGTEPFDWQPVHEPRAFEVLVGAVTWGLLAMEILLAVLFALPLGERVGWLRNAALIGFCATTYALAPVPGFGWLLLALGLAQCSSEASYWRAAYAIAFFLVLFYAEIPWARLALDGSARLAALPF